MEGKTSYYQEKQCKRSQDLKGKTNTYHLSAVLEKSTALFYSTKNCVNKLVYLFICILRHNLPYARAPPVHLEIRPFQDERRKYF